MVKWNEQHLRELVRKMGLRRARRQGGTPIHLSLYSSSSAIGSAPLLTQIMTLDANKWSALDYDETDRVSAAQYLGSLGCRADDALSSAACHQQPLSPELAKLLIDAGAFNKSALSVAAEYQRPLSPELAKALINARAFNKGALSNAACSQQPLTLELAKLLIDAGAHDKDALRTAAIHQRPLTLELAKLLIDVGAFDKEALRYAAMFQHPLTLELAKLLIDAGCDPVAHYGNRWDALVCLASDDHSVDPQVTDLFLATGCRTNLDGCERIFDKHRLRFDQILKEHAQWKESLGRMSAENVPTNLAVDWNR